MVINQSLYRNSNYLGDVYDTLRPYTVQPQDSEIPANHLLRGMRKHCNMSAVQQIEYVSHNYSEDITSDITIYILRPPK